MRPILIVLSLLLGLLAPAKAQIGLSIGLPTLSIGLQVSAYPALTRVPGYPVYYAPGLASNFFFYDGMYWVYESDNWYASAWYNGPWSLVAPDVVPLYMLRVPVRYFRSPPSYFRGWRADAAPRWGEHWGADWQQRRPGWDRWNRAATPAPAPLPAYQRQYSQGRYPQGQQQQTLRGENYHYQPQDTAVRQHFQEQAQPGRDAPRPSPGQRPGAPAAAARGDASPQPAGRPQDPPDPQPRKAAPAPAVRGEAPGPANRAAPGQRPAQPEAAGRPDQARPDKPAPAKPERPAAPSRPGDTAAGQAPPPGRAPPPDRPNKPVPNPSQQPKPQQQQQQQQQQQPKPQSQSQSQSQQRQQPQPAAQSLAPKQPQMPPPQQDPGEQRKADPGKGRDNGDAPDPERRR